MMIAVLSILQLVSITGMDVDSTQQKPGTAIITPEMEFSQLQIDQINKIVTQQVLDSPSYLIATGIAIIVAVMVGIAWVYIMKQKRRIKSLEKKLQENVEKTEIIENKSRNFEKKLEIIGNAHAYSSLSHSVMPQQVQKDSYIQPSNPAKKQEKCTINMYADFYLNGDTPMVDHRDLSDNPADGMFLIMVQDSSSKARYTVNQSKQKAIMEDLLNFSNFVNINDFPATYSSIKVESEGELVRNGASWKIIKKMNVKLI